MSHLLARLTYRYNSLNQKDPSSSVVQLHPTKNNLRFVCGTRVPETGTGKSVTHIQCLNNLAAMSLLQQSNHFVCGIGEGIYNYTNISSFSIMCMYVVCVHVWVWVWVGVVRCHTPAQITFYGFLILLVYFTHYKHTKLLLFHTKYTCMCIPTQTVEHTHMHACKHSHIHACTQSQYVSHKLLLKISFLLTRILHF